VFREQNIPCRITVDFLKAPYFSCLLFDAVFSFCHKQSRVTVGTLTVEEKGVIWVFLFLLKKCQEWQISF